MGKRNFRNNKGGNKTFGKREESRGSGPERQESWVELPRENAKWEKYYKAVGVVEEGQEWDEFKKACQESLPLTFRITGSKKHAHEINENFIQNHVSKLKDVEFEGKSIAPKLLNYYPNKLGWQIDVAKSVMRKNPDFAKTQRFLVIETEVGNISRQEAVSMIPPLVMDIKPHHSVLDMCAAPGSKTAQLVEALHQGDDVAAPTGFVIANDSDYKRSHMLVHQVKRLNSANFMVVNHDAQLFPRIKLNNSQEFLKFDRVLCDVPCSGDGTMRKNINVWRDFTVGNALGLHPLQLNILNRGLQLLKRGGRLVYSTCSLSPVENEAVVAAALRKWGDQIRLVDCSQDIPGLVRRDGISDWPVFGKDMELRQRGAEDVAESVFPPTEEEAKTFNLDRCIRVYPHLQNTGGFFITVFEKIDPTTQSTPAKRSNEESTEDEVKKPKVEDEKIKPHPQARTKMPRNANEEPFIFLPEDNAELKKCWPFYDFSEKFPKDCTLVRNATGEPLRSIYYVAPIIRDLLSIDDQKLKIIHAGIKLFVSQRNDAGDCPWRVQNESLHTLKQYIGESRQATCNLELLKHLFQAGFPRLSDLKDIDPEFFAKLDTMGEGCVFLNVKRGEGFEDLFLPLWKGRSNVNLMVNKKDTHELLYRVFGIETSAKDLSKETAYNKKYEEFKANTESAAEETPEVEEAPKVEETPEVVEPNEN